MHMRYHDMSVLNPNEIRQEIGYQDRTDEFGDKFVDEIEGERRQTTSRAIHRRGVRSVLMLPQKSVSRRTDDQDPPRGDQHDETPERADADSSA